MGRRTGQKRDDRIVGYPKKQADGRLAVTDWHGNVLGYGMQKCTHIPPHARGAWISSERCSYRFEIDGKWYSGRGRGDGISVVLRPMKSAPTRYL